MGAWIARTPVFHVCLWDLRLQVWLLVVPGGNPESRQVWTQGVKHWFGQAQRGPGWELAHVLMSD